MEKHPSLPPLRHRHYARCSFAKLENIEEERPCLALSLRPPETPTEAMEFLARSWSVSAVEISRALTSAEDNSGASSVNEASPVAELKIPAVSEAFGISPPISPRDHIDLKLLRNAARVKTMGGWLKDQREKRRAEARTRKAQAYAATSVAGVAAAVAAVVASTVFSGTEGAKVTCGDNKITAAIASAAALVASHCVEMAQTMGASHDQIIKAIRSAVGAQTNGDVMALTAGAATALRGAATLRARLYKEIQGATATGEDKESDRCLSALTFVARGGELLKRTRKGVLHWKHVSVFINSNWQVVVKTKSTHMVGTFVKKKKSIVIDVSSNVQAWPGRELEYDGNQKAYFAIRTPERLIEFECKKCEKKIWVEGIRQMLDCRENMVIVKPM